MPGRKTRTAKPGEPRCGAPMTEGHGGACPRPAGYGTDHEGTGYCRRHGGNLKRGNLLVANEELEGLLGAPVDVDPGEALLYCVALASQELSWVNSQLAKVTEPTHLAPVGNLGGPQKGYVGMQEEFDIYILARQTAIDRLARYSKMALDAGVAERMVSLAERMGDLITPLLAGVLGELKLTPEQQQIAPVAVQKHLTLLEMRTGPGKDVAA